MSTPARRGLPRGKFDGVPTIELPLDLSEQPTGVTERQRRPRAIAFLRCPECTSGTRGTVPVERSGDHAVWRDHDVVTYSGARIPCRASGVRLCVAEPRREPGELSACLCKRPR